MEYGEEVIRKIVQVGTLGYPLSKVLNVVDIENEEQFSKDFYNPNSIVFKSYKKGLDKADFILDSKLFDMAKNGDLKALQLYEQKKRDRQLESEKEGRGKLK